MESIRRLWHCGFKTASTDEEQRLYKQTSESEPRFRPPPSSMITSLIHISHGGRGKLSFSAQSCCENKPKKEKDVFSDDVSCPVSRASRWACPHIVSGSSITTLQIVEERCTKNMIIHISCNFACRHHVYSTGGKNAKNAAQIRWWVHVCINLRMFSSVLLSTVRRCM